MPRHNGTTKIIDLDKRPICKYCKNPIKIVTTSIIGPIVGLTENYNVQKRYYKYGKASCQGGEEPPIKPKNVIYPPKSDYDCDLYAKVGEFRWNRKLTHEEIIEQMKKDFGIVLNLATTERMLKTYEIGCSQKYKPEYTKKIQANGGVLLKIDGMKPLKGNSPLYTTRDEFTGLEIHSKRLTKESKIQIKEYLIDAKQRIETELVVKVIGIISDALPNQGKAITEVFPGVSHCLCHYHFYNFVFKAPKDLDSNLMTQTRKSLRGLYFLNKEKIYANQGKHWGPKFYFTKEVLTILRSLSNWKPRPKDPFFVSAELFSRLTDVNFLLQEFIAEINAAGKHFEDENVIRKIHIKVKEFIGANQDKKRELETIRVHLSEIKSILDEEGASAENALDLLEGYCKKLAKLQLRKDCGLIEAQFIEKPTKSVETKGELLFNYKQIERAPKTNNLHELSFKQLIYFLRKIIGFRTAKSYLLSHGEYIIFVNPQESFKRILEIFKNMDYEKARELIRSERTSRDNIRFVMHDLIKWNSKLQDLKQKAQELIKWLFMKN
ncbi:MAG: hypothetical protein ACTSRI_19340 [Promethearchaeota archaeon]